MRPRIHPGSGRDMLFRTSVPERSMWRSYQTAGARGATTLWSGSPAR